MVKEFISHSKKDFQLVIALSIYLKAYGVGVELVGLASLTFYGLYKLSKE